MKIVQITTAVLAHANAPVLVALLDDGTLMYRKTPMTMNEEAPWVPLEGPKV